MKAILIGVNAKYIQSNLAIRYIQKYAQAQGVAVERMELTINQPKHRCLAEIYDQKPDVLGFSCYIWNMEFIKALLRDIKKVLPKAFLVLGGPEVSYDAQGILAENPAADCVISGQGEDVFWRLVKDGAGNPALNEIAGITYRQDGVVKVNPPMPFSFLNTQFPYDDAEFAALSGRIIYYESQRGCPFRCSYCLSSQETGVELLPLERVYEELDIFLKKQVRQVKFVDRTFNCRKTHRRSIWQYLINHDNGITNFHFELSADILEEEDFKILSTARKGLFQFEIGVQSTCPETLEEIDRKADFNEIRKNVQTLRELKTIHLHLDLIAGLPFEDWARFRSSFNDVFALGGGMLQLGFLKVLKGSKMHRRAEVYDLLYSDLPPYEVFSTRWMSYRELLKLKNIEHVLESYYNSALAMRTVEYLLPLFETPFDFFHALGEFWQEKSYGTIEHSKMKMFEHLLEFAEECSRIQTEQLEVVKETLVFDILRNDNIKKLPPALSGTMNEEERAFVDKAYGDDRLMAAIEQRLGEMDRRTRRRQTNIVFFNRDILGDLAPKTQAVLFYYLEGNARGTPVSISLSGGG